MLDTGEVGGVDGKERQSVHRGYRGDHEIDPARLRISSSGENCCDNMAVPSCCASIEWDRLEKRLCVLNAFDAPGPLRGIGREVWPRGEFGHRYRTGEDLGGQLIRIDGIDEDQDIGIDQAALMDGGHESLPGANSPRR